MSQGGGRRSAGKRDGGGFTSHDDGRGARRDGILNVSAGKRRASTRRLFDQTQDSFKLLAVGASGPRVSEAGSDPTMMKSS